MAASQFQLKDFEVRSRPSHLHDFLPGTWDSFLESEINREIAAENDLRFESSGHVVSAQILPWDSDFFSMKTARMDFMTHRKGQKFEPKKALQELIDKAKKQNVQYLWTQVDPAESELILAMQSLGWVLIETRIFNYRSLPDFKTSERYAVRMAQAKETHLLAETAAKMINPYDRFRAEPIFSEDRVNEFMRVWTKASIESGFADATLVPDAENPKAFLTVKYNKSLWSSWGAKPGNLVLGAVDPEFRGWFKKLITEACWLLKDQGAEHVVMCSQITNKASFRAWEDLGFKFGKGSYIYRIDLR